RLAWASWAYRSSAAVRLEAARCLALPGCAAPLGVLEWVVAECGEQGSLAPLAGRLRLLGRGGYAAGPGRLAGAEALLALLGRPDVAPGLREALLSAAVGWVARPLRDGGRQVDEEARALLATTLPDAGPSLAPAVLSRLRADGFDDPS